MATQRSDKYGASMSASSEVQLARGQNSVDRQLVAADNARGNRGAFQVIVPEGEGLLVALYGIEGLTAPDILKRPFYFQCPPLESFSVSTAFNWSTWQTISQGDMASPGGKALSTISFQTLFVEGEQTWTFRSSPERGALGVPTNPQATAARLRAIVNRGTPFGLVVGNRELWTNNDVHWGPVNGNAAVITQADIEERVGEEDARYVSVTFQEYREPKLVRRGQGKKKSTGRSKNVPTKVVIDEGGEAREVKDGKPTSRVVVHNATFQKLAKHYYGRQSDAKEIRNANDGMSNVAVTASLGAVARKRKSKKLTLRIPKMNMVAQWQISRVSAGSASVGDSGVEEE